MTKEEIFNKEEREKIRLIANETNKLYKDVHELCELKMDELKGLISPKGAIFVVGKTLGVETDTKKSEDEKIKWKLIPETEKNKGVKDMSIWDDIDLSTNEFLPFLKIKNGIVYHLQLVDPSGKPRPSVDGYGNDQHIWDVKLLDLEPVRAFKDTDKEGKAIFMKNKTYSMGMKKTAMRRFKDFWLAIEKMDKFTYERTGASYQTDYVFKED